ncbi:winged helix-turn-helix domain-containing protein [Streptomyces sp. NBC_01239]|uniref:GntR family transcriptional regulator n=1 Tax=Streptomyces sp. NBC_01239 TaxID=2903792 RepID=UPI002252B362|nr:winged helix-turn-helix domain-containing protein [Streptomyces sp. NBC_01239]MCX4816801.1 winged helix-turn-helix domain-containing protein [Streptomyces sp. NBC_01239]MCX4818249.1 winged helix-turn-helix domain-containing protein [Streptomyces sp. NBC_01239]
MGVDLDRTRSVWRQVAATMQARIVDGEYPTRSKLPSVVELSAEFEVAASTVQKVYRLLQEQGFARGEVGIGTFVVDELPQPPEGA